MNPPQKPFLQSCFHFQATLGDMKALGGYFQPNMKALVFFFQGEKNYLIAIFFLFCALPKERAVTLTPCQTFLIYMNFLEGID